MPIEYYIMSKRVKKHDSDLSEDTDESSGPGASQCSSGVKKKRASKSYDQVFRSEWLADPDMKSWLTRDKKDQNAFCKFCNTAIKPKLSVLRTHMTSKKHRALTDSAQGSNKVGLGGK